MPIVQRKTAFTIRKTHRYLGIFIGIQFLFWTTSGLYFSWTDLNEIHGDHFKKEHVHHNAFTDLRSPSDVVLKGEIHSMTLKEIAGEPYYWINQSKLINAKTGTLKEGITQQEAVTIAGKHMKSGLEIEDVEKITSTGNHHEYRGKPLPAWVISFNTPQNIKAYVSVKDGSFQTLRHRDWRWFDFLWMTHTMDYEGRDDFNNILLRAFSVLGLITVFSGFLLWFISSPTIITWIGKKKKREKVRQQ